MAEKRKALVVDDTAFHSDFLKMFLRMKQYDVTVATDGLEAMSLCRKAQFDVVFSDIEMPNMNGIELLRSLKRMNSYASVPVIMLSTLDNQEMKDKAASLGAFAYVVKPFNSAKMDEVFSRLK